MLVVLFAHLLCSGIAKLEEEGSIPPLADFKVGKKAILCLIKSVQNSSPVS